MHTCITKNIAVDRIVSSGFFVEFTVQLTAL